MLKPFKQIECVHQRGEHGQIVGPWRGLSRSKLAQVWPPEMCRRIVEGTCLLIRQLGKQRSPIYAMTDSEYDCLACVGRKAKTDPCHTRSTTTPHTCTFPHVDPMRYPCPGCVQYKPSNHPSHTHIQGECRHPRARAPGERGPRNDIPRINRAIGPTLLATGAAD